MAEVMPKVKMYAFLSMIVLLINLCVFFVGLIDNSSHTLSDYTKETQYNEDQLLSNNESVDLGAFASATGTSFIPFVNLIQTAFFSNLPIEARVITGIVLTMISAFQLFLLTVIVMNMLPKVLGSGWDV